MFGHFTTLCMKGLSKYSCLTLFAGNHDGSDLYKGKSQTLKTRITVTLDVKSWVAVNNHYKHWINFARTQVFSDPFVPIHDSALIRENMSQGKPISLHILQWKWIMSEPSVNNFKLTLSWRRPLSYRNQSIDLLCKSMDWFLYNNGLRHERVKDSLESLLNTNYCSRYIGVCDLF